MSRQELARAADPYVRHNSYRPNPDTVRATQRTKLVTVSSIYGIGVRALMQEVRDKNPSMVSIPFAFTTGLSEPVDGLGDTNKTAARIYSGKRAEVLGAVMNGSLVQVAFGPGDDLHGTYLGDYDATKVNVASLPVAEVVHMEEQRLFASITKMCIVPENPHEYMASLQTAELPPEIFRTRLVEAESSIMRALEPDLHKRFLFIATSGINKRAVETLCQVVQAVDESMTPHELEGPLISRGQEVGARESAGIFVRAISKQLRCATVR